MFAEIAIPLYIDETFTYRVPERLEAAAQVGCRCLLPFGNRALTGYIVALSLSTNEEIPLESIKDISSVLDETPIIIPEVLELTRWIADYYYAPWGEVLKAAPSTPRELQREGLTEIKHRRGHPARRPKRQKAGRAGG